MIGGSIAGSNIHVLGQTLAHALSLDRVLIVLDDEEHPFYDTQYCKSGENFHDCYFEPISSCTIEDVRRAAGAALQELRKYDVAGCRSSIQAASKCAAHCLLMRVTTLFCVSPAPCHYMLSL